MENSGGCPTHTQSSPGRPSTTHLHPSPLSSWPASSPSPPSPSQSSSSSLSSCLHYFFSVVLNSCLLFLGPDGFGSSDASLSSSLVSRHWVPPFHCSLSNSPSRLCCGTWELLGFCPTDKAVSVSPDSFFFGFPPKVSWSLGRPWALRGSLWEVYSARDSFQAGYLRLPCYEEEIWIR